MHGVKAIIPAYLETRLVGKRALELHHHTANLVAHSSMALVVVNGRSMAVVTTCRTGGSGSRSGGDSGSRCALGACLATSHQTSLERWACSSACCTGSTGSVATCERHDCKVGWYWLTGGNRWMNFFEDI